MAPKTVKKKRTAIFVFTGAVEDAGLALVLAERLAHSVRDALGDGVEREVPIYLKSYGPI